MNFHLKTCLTCKHCGIDNNCSIPKIVKCFGVDESLVEIADVPHPDHCYTRWNKDFEIPERCPNKLEQFTLDKNDNYQLDLKKVVKYLEAKMWEVPSKVEKIQFDLLPNVIRYDENKLIEFTSIYSRLSEISRKLDLSRENEIQLKINEFRESLKKYEKEICELISKYASSILEDIR